MKSKQFLVVCSKCGRPRSQIEHFYRYGEKRERRQRSICKPCHYRQTSESRRLRLAEVNALARARRRGSPRAVAYSIWKGAKDRARKRNIEFSITREWVESRLALAICAATAVPFDLTETTTRQNPRAPSLDRINPKLGYIADNCRIVTWIFNRAKGDNTDEDVRKMAEALLAVKELKAA